MLMTRNKLAPALTRIHLKSELSCICYYDISEKVKCVQHNSIEPHVILTPGLIVLGCTGHKLFCFIFNDFYNFV